MSEKSGLSRKKEGNNIAKYLIRPKMPVITNLYVTMDSIKKYDKINDIEHVPAVK